MTKKDKNHKDQMEDLKASMDEKIAEVKKDKGLILVLTGDGKGKSSSGFGMLLRCLGHGMKVGVVQFIKGQWKTGEQKFCQSHPDVDYFSIGEGFTWDTQDKEGDIGRTAKCWAKAKEMIQNPELSFVLIDELNVVTSFGYLDVDEVVATLKSKPENKHVVVTGRGASPKILELADTISKIDSPKHAFDNGIRAQKGIEF